MDSTTTQLSDSKVRKAWSKADPQRSEQSSWKLALETPEDVIGSLKRLCLRWGTLVLPNLTRPTATGLHLAGHCISTSHFRSGDLGHLPRPSLHSTSPSGACSLSLLPSTIPPFLHAVTPSPFPQQRELAAKAASDTNWIELRRSPGPFPTMSGLITLHMVSNLEFNTVDTNNDINNSLPETSHLDQLAKRRLRTSKSAPANTRTIPVTHSRTGSLPTNVPTTPIVVTKPPAAVKRTCKTQQWKIMTSVEDQEHFLTTPGQANQRTDPIGMDSLRQEVGALSTAIVEPKTNPVEGLANDVRVLWSNVNCLLERWSLTSPNASKPMGRNQTTHTKAPNDRQRHARQSVYQEPSRRFSAKLHSKRS